MSTKRASERQREKESEREGDKRGHEGSPRKKAAVKKKRYCTRDTSPQFLDGGSAVIRIAMVVCLVGHDWTGGEVLVVPPRAPQNLADTPEPA